MGVLFREAWRPTQSGMEMHLLRIHKLIERVKPQCVVVKKGQARQGMTQ